MAMSAASPPDDPPAERRRLKGFVVVPVTLFMDSAIIMETLLVRTSASQPARTLRTFESHMYMVRTMGVLQRMHVLIMCGRTRNIGFDVEYRAEPAQHLDQLRILRHDLVRPRAVADRGRIPRNLEVVLDGHGQAVQRADGAPVRFVEGIQLVRSPQRLVKQNLGQAVCLVYVHTGTPYVNTLRPGSRTH